MTFQEVFREIKREKIPENLTVKCIDDAYDFHEQVFIPFRTELRANNLTSLMPHYRGEQKNGWDIVSGIFRSPLDKLSNSEGKNLEKLAIIEFENIITTKIGDNILRTIFNHKTYGKDWDLLFQAQHGGIKTTLTDWTAYIINALYFATEFSSNKEIENADAQLWCLMVPEKNIISDSDFFIKKSIYEMNPYNLENFYLLNPSIFVDNVYERIFEYRMYKQSGRFLALPNDYCNIPINKNDMFKDILFQIRIPKEYKESIRQSLTKKGITRERLFAVENPTHDKLIKDINCKIFKLE